MNPANVYNTDLGVNIYPCHTAQICENKSERWHVQSFRAKIGQRRQPLLILCLSWWATGMRWATGWSVHREKWSGRMEPQRSPLHTDSVHTPNTTKESLTWEKTTRRRARASRPRKKPR